MSAGITTGLSTNLADVISVAPHVYAAIAAVSGELAKTGIAKDRRNEQQRYSFRGIDEVLNALAPLLVKHGLVILPRILSRECVERTAKSGSAQYFTTVDAEFDCVATLDGSKHTVRTFGEAQDSGDKSTNKAMSAAYKYAAFLMFCIPTEGDNDADATTPEPSMPRLVARKAAPPAGFSEWTVALSNAARDGTPSLRFAWDHSAPELKAYMTQVHPDQWETIKAQAQAVTEPA